jgi:molecular chaperone DnaK
MSKRVYGIDLGTTYSCIAYVDEHGKPTVVHNAEGELTTPSVVYFESPDNVVVGRTAKDVSVIHNDRVVSTIKRQMGNPNYEFAIDGKTYRPEEISAHILRKLVKDAAAVTGDDIKDVVITCPAYFGVVEKEATKQAGIIAGLNVLYVIPEPTAAAIAYGLEQTKAHNIIVYDLGGGTFDVTLISISTGEITVIATDGDVQLGGKDWDDAIVGYLAQAFEAETGTSAHQVTDDLESYQELLNDAEKIKIRLTGAKSITHRVRYQAGSAVVEVTREKFDEITLPLLERTVSFTEAMLERAKERGVGKIDKLLLVGGATYMPQITDRMSKFPFEIKQFDPNQAVAKGAALFGYRYALEELIKIRVAEQTGQAADKIDLAAVPTAVKEAAERRVATEEGLPLPGLKKLVDTKIRNVSSKSFGVIVVVDERTAREEVSNLVIVDDAVPRDMTRQFSTLYENQTEVEIRVMQNKQRTEPGDTIDLSLCDPKEPIGTAVLPFAKPLPKDSPIEVTFSLAPDGLLSLHGRDLTTGAEIKAVFKTEAVMSEEQLEQARSRAMKMTVS